MVGVAVIVDVLVVVVLGVVVGLGVLVLVGVEVGVGVFCIQLLLTQIPTSVNPALIGIILLTIAHNGNVKP